MAGVEGPAGATGATGAQGSIGQTGAQGVIGSTGARGYSNPSWSYTFQGYSDDIPRSDSGKAREIANALNQNPSSRVTIDSPSQRYVQSVVEALNTAGVPTSKIQTGAFTDPNLRNDHRVDVMVSNR